MSAVIQSVPDLPAPVARRGIDEAAWRTAMTSLFPGAKPESVLMVFDYCKARKLDPLKKPCHIVPIEVKDAASGQYVWRDVVMPGIYEYRTTAQRTGEYLGHSVPTYGPVEDYKGVFAPSWCSMTVYRWNPVAKVRAEFPVTVQFREVVATKRDGSPNARWSKAPNQMLTKCTEAAALREGFPDELGGTQTVEEVEGRIIESEPAESVRHDPRGDLSGVDFELRDHHVSAIADILNADKEELEIADMLRDYQQTYFAGFPELEISVCDELKAKGIATKAQYRAWLKVGLDRK